MQKALGKAILHVESMHIVKLSPSLQEEQCKQVEICTVLTVEHNSMQTMCTQSGTSKRVGGHCIMPWRQAIEGHIDGSGGGSNKIVTTALKKPILYIKADGNNENTVQCLQNMWHAFHNHVLATSCRKAVVTLLPFPCDRQCNAARQHKHDEQKRHHQ